MQSRACVCTRETYCCFKIEMLGDVTVAEGVRHSRMPWYQISIGTNLYASLATRGIKTHENEYMLHIYALLSLTRSTPKLLQDRRDMRDRRVNEFVFDTHP